ncbi:polysaccharide biosynthesis tyrosine autokinase [Dictyobacter aurantiacus]|uniref:non-specific protein-tyrosine kinase n=1 Tax=Dictyobacter aurantiacus TaxID=1936993 RepID=A0A401ZA55_9CHLR|nr:polysaccharide biosynthesis tyrosine autokinase [Dictyobacter aurantiacus]GCE03722.1 capsular exopolysaccharide biosynthesis protein [Dictyobacter aurantiacus]
MRSTLSRYILLAKRWAWVIILGMVICGGTTYLVTKLLMQPVYEAQTRILITLAGTSQNDSTLAAIAQQSTYSQLVTNPNVLAPVAAKHNMELKQLTGMVKTQSATNSPIIDILVDSSNPQLAATLSKEVAQSFTSYATSHLASQANFNTIDPVVPTDPVRPRPSQDSLIGALIGLGLALAIIVIFEWIDDRLTAPEEVNKLLGIDALTIIPELSRKQRSRNAEDTPELAEGCRILCANLNMAQMMRPFKLVMVTSPMAGEGKSTIAANMASFLAMSGKRVLLVDADLRHPVLDQHFQLNNQKGLSNAFLGIWNQVETELDGQPTEIPSLRVLTAGVLPSNPSELLQSQLASQLFNHFRNSQKFDYIIFDTPPLLPIADAQIMAAYMQVTIMVVNASRTPRKAMVRAKQALARTGTRILGVALNKSYWPEYGEVHDYLSNIQSRPRADIAMAMPPNTPAINHAIDATNTAILPSTNNKR